MIMHFWQCGIGSSASFFYDLICLFAAENVLNFLLKILQGRNLKINLRSLKWLR
jgi:hypothetical protein